MRDSAAPHRGRMAALAALAGRVVMVAGGVALAVRVGVPASRGPRASEGGAGEQDESGRGRRATPASRPSLSAGHETEDMSARLMARVLVGLGSAAGLMVLLMLGFENLVIPAREHGQLQLTSQQMTHPAPPAPNLQSDPVADLARLNAAADRLLNHYGRIDADHARIPIGRAMSLIVGRPLDTAP